LGFIEICASPSAQNKTAEKVAFTFSSLPIADAWYKSRAFLILMLYYFKERSQNPITHAGGCVASIGLHG
jgi:hypothetical protein